MKIEFNNTEPIYQQIINHLLHAVARKEYLPGEKLPSVREMAGLLKVNPNTIARVYQELEREGYLEKRRGLGTYLTENEDKWEGIRGKLAKQALEEFLDTMKALGFTVEKAFNFFKNYLKGEE